MLLEASHPVVYDAGALIAADSDSRRMRSLHKDAVETRRSIIVPTPVLTQVWRDGRKQARLSRLLKGCVVMPPDEAVAKHAGVLLGDSRTSDAVDAIVVATALILFATIVTSDSGDLARLLDAARVPFRPGLIPV
ncbi:MAG TPA: PIN domain-containing protein [Mycobacteriales bacterium]|nr:PIN domain-containing protein [Mycobacteriales bacterium]